jgi:hypothetical protein
MNATYQSLLLAVAASCLPAVVSAGDLEDALRRCAKTTGQAQRLACFDAIVSTLPQVEADRFGMTADIERKRDPGKGCGAGRENRGTLASTTRRVDIHTR